MKIALFEVIVMLNFQLIFAQRRFIQNSEHHRGGGIRRGTDGILKFPNRRSNIKRYEPLIDGKPIYLNDDFELQNSFKKNAVLKNQNTRGTYDLGKVDRIDEIFEDDFYKPVNSIQNNKNLLKYEKPLYNRDASFSDDQVFIEKKKKKIGYLAEGMPILKGNGPKKHLKQNAKYAMSRGSKIQKYPIRRTGDLEYSTTIDPILEITLLKNESKVSECIEQGFEKLEETIKNAPSTNDEPKDEAQSTTLRTVQDIEHSKHPPLGLKEEISRSFNKEINSFVFNPLASPDEIFQECTTLKNESGHCRYVQHCFIPSILSSIQSFMNNTCIIDGNFIGICCPEFPVSEIKVNWANQQSNITEDDIPPEATDECGVSANTRIVGGTDANKKEWPWMVALLDHRRKFFCGGALINDRYVLTAAHCTLDLPNNRIIARVGDFDFKATDESAHDDYFVTEIKRHGQYRRFTLRNDIALLRLEKPVKFGESVSTICLPSSEKDYLGENATLVGWGNLKGGASQTSEVLQEASFPIIDNSECARSHSITIHPSVICAAAPSKDKGACNGDSGGPLMLLDDDKHWKIIGVVSWGRRGCSPKFPTAYTRITFYLDWIKKHSS